MNQIIKSASEAMSIGDTFYRSGMFTDVKSAQQAVVKIMAGAEMGISPFAAMSGVHIIQGKPVIGAGLMASRVKAYGKYDYKVKEHTDKVCSIEYFKGTESIGISTFTIEDARKAGTKNLDKFPRNMLFARAMSNGVKWFTPDIYESPVYVPEEMETVDTVAEVLPKKRTLGTDEFVKLCVKVSQNATVKDSDELVFYWAIENLALTDEQLQRINDIYFEINKKTDNNEQPTIDNPSNL